MALGDFLIPAISAASARTNPITAAIQAGSIVGKALGFDPIGSLFGKIFGGGSDRNINISGFTVPDILEGFNVPTGGLSGVRSNRRAGAFTTQRELQRQAAERSIQQFMMDLGLTQERQQFDKAITDVGGLTSSFAEVDAFGQARVNIMANTLQAIFNELNKVSENSSFQPQIQEAVRKLGVAKGNPDSPPLFSKTPVNVFTATPTDLLIKNFLPKQKTFKPEQLQMALPQLGFLNDFTNTNLLSGGGGNLFNAFGQRGQEQSKLPSFTQGQPFRPTGGNLFSAKQKAPRGLAFLS